MMYLFIPSSLQDTMRVDFINYGYESEPAGTIQVSHIESRSL